MSKKQRKKRIRVSAKALIIRDDAFLVIRKRELEPSGSADAEYLVLPGGGQHHGEALSDAVIRECEEELGIRVVPKDIVFVRDYIGAHHEFAHIHPQIHQLEVVFACEIDDVAGNIGGGSEEDPGQIGIEWIGISKLEETPLYPKALKSSIRDYLCGKHTRIYLGDVN